MDRSTLALVAEIEAVLVHGLHHLPAETVRALHMDAVTALARSCTAVAAGAAGFIERGGDQEDVAQIWPAIETIGSQLRQLTDFLASPEAVGQMKRPESVIGLGWEVATLRHLDALADTFTRQGQGLN
jgi:hypothetical protein